MARTRHILRVGVTGGIGSGKSAVCEVFERLGVPVLSADLIAREISDANPRVKAKIRKLLGESAYHSGGTLNRSFVASRIFSDRKLPQALNRIIHPPVIKEIKRRSDELERQGAPLVIVEAALVYEAGLDKEMDYVVVVQADEPVRIRRAMQRDETVEEEIRRRIRSQWPAQTKLRMADYVLMNNGSLEDLARRVRFLHEVFRHLTAKGNP